MIIKTDKCSLKYLASKKLLEGIQHKLMLKLLQFHFSIQYKKGVENTTTYALSRKNPVEETLAFEGKFFATSAAVPLWTMDIMASYARDKNCIKLLQQLAIKKTANLTTLPNQES